MTERQAPSVTVRFVPIPGGVELEFSSPNTGLRPTFNLSDTSRIGHARQILRDGLCDLKSLAVKHFDGVRVRDEGLTEISARMASTGRLMITTVCPQNSRLLNQLQEFWRRSARHWDTPGHPPAVVEYVGHPEYVIPIEHMPFFDLAGCGKPTTDPNTFVQQCRAFVGFSCVVRRKLLLDGPIPLRGDATSGVRLRVSDLKDHFTRLAGEGRSDVAMPLIVLNACGTSAADPVTATSFPRVFLENENRAVIRIVNGVV